MKKAYFSPQMTVLELKYEPIALDPVTLANVGGNELSGTIEREPGWSGWK